MRREDGPACRFIETARPVDLDERPSRKKLAGGPVQYIKETVAIGPKQQLARGSVPIGIDENWDLYRVVIVRVIRRELKIPLQSPGIGVKGDD